MKDLISKDWVKRTLKTFCQTALGYIAVNMVVLVSDINTGDLQAVQHAVVGLLVSAVSAGLCAVMNYKKEEKEEEKEE